MPLLTSSQGAQTTPSGAWFVGLWIPTHPRKPQDQLCASSGILAELSALHHSFWGALGEGGWQQGWSAAARMQETQLTRGEVLSVESLSTGERRAFHPLKPPPQQGFNTGCSTDTTSGQAILLRLQCWARKGSSTNPVLAARSSQEHR